MEVDEYHIRGTTSTEIDVSETVTAKSEKHALGLIQKKYGTKLKKPFDIYTVTQLEEGAELPEEALRRAIDQLLPDDDILRIAGAIRAKSQVDPDEYRLFRSVFKPMIRRLGQDLWTDVTIMTKEELEEELYAFIINEFLPRYTPGRGRLFGYMKMNLRSRVIRKWRREKYVNAEKPNAKAKYAILEDFARGVGAAAERVSRETERNKAILACKMIYTENPPMTIRERREFYTWIVRLGLHKELVRSEKQRQALEMIYGSDGLTEAEAAQQLGLTQATLHANKVRGEANVLKNAAKKS